MADRVVVVAAVAPSWVPKHLRQVQVVVAAAAGREAADHHLLLSSVPPRPRLVAVVVAADRAPAVLVQSSSLRLESPCPAHVSCQHLQNRCCPVLARCRPLPLTPPVSSVP